MRFTEDEASLLTAADLPYLALCAALLFAAALIRAIAYVALRPWRVITPTPCSLNCYDVAMLRGGWFRVVASAIAGLADAGAVTLHPGAVAEIRPGPRAGADRDPVQSQVFDLLSDYPNGGRLVEAFSRTAIAADLQRKLVASGIMLPRQWRFVFSRWLFGALVFIAMSATVVEQWGESGAKFTALLFLELMMCGVCLVLCEQYLPLTLSQPGVALNARLQELGDHEPSADPIVQCSGRDIADLLDGDEGWRLEQGWVGSAAGRVAFGGWDEYRDRWGQPIPLQFWELIPENVVRTPKEHQRRSLFFRVMATVCGVLAIPCAVISFSGAAWVGVFWLLLAAIGARCGTLARKHRAAGRRDPRGVIQDPGMNLWKSWYSGAPYPHRPSVLYLRSFAHHDALLEKTTPWQNIKSAILGSSSSYIEEIVHVLRAFGPPIAIGNPGVALPGLGVVELAPLAPDLNRPGGQLDRWQVEVLRLMDSSALVVIAAGLGEGLLWEFQQAASRVPPCRLVVIVPLDCEGYALFREQVGAYFERGLPADIRVPDRRGEINHALIYFNRDWTPRFAGFADHPLAQLHLGRVATRLSVRRYRNQIAHAMYPVFRANDVRWPGTEIPAPFAQASQQKLVTGMSLGLAAAVLGVGGPLIAFGLSSLW
ncbi:TIGR04222 domain-containing membrane protein [Streptomyces sp. NPDC102283]|uniref:TIGR04222 domain-containing membrane protein n=1 Tax=Streptomyces sp. NPDC102283 TaxID=3366155 RepID=UPI00382064C2